MCISDLNLFRASGKIILRLHISNPSGDMSIYHEFHRNCDNSFAGNNGFSRKIHGSESKVLTGISLSAGFCFQMNSPTLGIVSRALSLIAAFSRIFTDLLCKGKASFSLCTKEPGETPAPLKSTAKSALASEK